MKNIFLAVTLCLAGVSQAAEFHIASDTNQLHCYSTPRGEHRITHENNGSGSRYIIVDSTGQYIVEYSSLNAAITARNALNSGGISSNQVHF